MAIKKAKLNYMSAVSTTKPVERIPVSSSHMEMLDADIKSKVRQNEANRRVGEQTAKQYLVR